MAPAHKLPLFPLSNVVLFPDARVPLHIFEPRYRQMMEAALAGERTIGMAPALPEQEMGGEPPLFPIGCAGFIAAHQKLADGRYDLVLQGTRRFRIVAEQPPEGDRLYRVASVEWIEEDAAEGSDRDDALRGRRDRVVEMLETLARRATRGEEVEIESDRLEQLDDSTFTNALCAAIGLSPAEKQSLLEANGVSKRLELLESVLQFHVMAGAPAGEGNPRVH